MAAFPSATFDTTSATTSINISRGFADVCTADSVWDSAPRAREKERAGLRLTAAQHHRLHIRWLTWEADKEEKWVARRWVWEPAPTNLFLEYIWNLYPPEGLNQRPDPHLKLLRFVREPMAR